MASGNRLENMERARRKAEWLQKLRGGKAEIYAHTRTPCSCWACGNPRRNLKGSDRLTVQERRALDSERED